MFPEYRDVISKLKTTDAHFAKVFDKHNELDEKIINLEKDPVASVSREEEIDALKKEKLALKDELFKMAILGFALTEAIALFSLMMAFLILFAL